MLLARNMANSSQRMGSSEHWEVPHTSCGRDHQNAVSSWLRRHWRSHTSKDRKAVHVPTGMHTQEDRDMQCIISDRTWFGSTSGDGADWFWLNRYSKLAPLSDPGRTQSVSANGPPLP